MNITDIREALTEVQDSDPPTRKSDIAALVKALSDGALTPLRDWVGDLTNALDETDQAGVELTDADTADRESFHETLVSTVADLLAVLDNVSPTE